MKAVITAGGRIDGRFAADAGSRVKALAPVRGCTMLRRMIDALRGAGASSVALVGGDEVRSACGAEVERFVDESPSGSENVLRALRAWPDDGEPLLYGTSDLPYVTAAAVDAFVERVPAGTLAVPLADAAHFARRFPNAPPFGITLGSQRVVNGGVFVLPPGSAERVAALATGFFDARKRPWQMAGLVGPGVLLRFLLRRLSVGDLEALAVRALGIPALAVPRCAPELAFDCDTAAEYDYARAHA